MSFLSERHWVTPTLAELTLLDSSCASTTPPAWPRAPSCALLVRVATVFTMGAYYDEVEIEDMAWDEEKRVYHYPCPCGDRFEISRKQLANYEDIATCPSCSLVIRVIYDPVRGYHRVQRNETDPNTSSITRMSHRTTRMVSLREGRRKKRKGIVKMTSSKMLSTALRSPTSSPVRLQSQREVIFSFVKPAQPTVWFAPGRLLSCRRLLICYGSSHAILLM